MNVVDDSPVDFKVNSTKSKARVLLAADIHLLLVYQLKRIPAQNACTSFVSLWTVAPRERAAVIWYPGLVCFLSGCLHMSL